VDVPGSDAALLNAIRSGDPGAYDVLRARHGAAARRLARYLPRGGAAADDVVDWSFTQVLDAIRRGGGPTDAFRPYLLTATARAARDCAAGEAAPVPADDQDIPAPGLLPGGNSRDPVVAAFLSLPERWRAVLWHTEVEGTAPAAVASLFGLSAEGTADLAASAREGLGRSLDIDGPEAGGVGLTDLTGALRASVAPLVLGPATTAYLADAANGAIGATDSAAASGAVGYVPAGDGAADHGRTGYGVTDHGVTDRGAAGGLAAVGLAAAGAAAAAAAAEELGFSAAPVPGSGPEAGAPPRPGRPPRPGTPQQPGRTPRLRVPPKAGTGTRPGAGSRPGTGGPPGGPGAPGRGGATPRPSVLGAAAMSEMAATTAELPDHLGQEPPREPRRGRPDEATLRPRPRQARARPPREARARLAAGRATAAVLAAVALIGARSRLALHHWADDTGRQKEITAVSAAVLLVLGVVGYAVLLHAGSGSTQQVAAPTPIAASTGTTGPTASAPPPSSPAASPSSHASPSQPPVPVDAVANNPPPPPPPPVRLAAMINVQGPVGFSRLAQVQFTVADFGPRATAADVTAAIALPRGVFPLPGMGINGWSCSVASPGVVCVHAPFAAGASANDIFSALVGVMSACRQSVQLTATSGGAQAFASAVIPCGSGGAQPG
jgi:DNA-directed RNA polymerase specialized sigma24 family protein